MNSHQIIMEDIWNFTMFFGSFTNQLIGLYLWQISKKPVICQKYLYEFLKLFFKFTNLLVHLMIMKITLIGSENICKYYKRSHILFKRLRNVDALSLAAPSVDKTEHFESSFILLNQCFANRWCHCKILAVSIVLTIYLRK